MDLIYLDPPFNSKRTYEAPIGSKAAGAAFKDTWHLSDLNVAWMGLIADEQPAIATLLDAAGQTHSKGMQSYLTMMAVRLLELRRVLKDTGSLYLHCDPVADSYLRLLLDAVFGQRNFRNAITWQRSPAHSDARGYGANTDTILFYTASNRFAWNAQHQQYSEQYLKRFRRKDAAGRAWTDDNLTAKGLAGGGYEYAYKGATSLWRVPLETMEQLDVEGRLHFTQTGAIRRKRFLDELPGRPVQALWTDIPLINSQSMERVGYPTQKPIALLERIIRASSNEGDVVLDPFAGCATACVAAERLGRQWVGIDLSPKAVELVRYRLARQESRGGNRPSEPGEMIALWSQMVTDRTDIPRRTDIDAPKNYRQNKHVLYGQQEGRCGGCAMDFPFKIMEVDHVVPQSKGGGNHLGNLQLLCGHCNKVKGDKPMEHLVAELTAAGH